MSAELRLIDPPSLMWRVGRLDAPCQFSWMAPEDRSQPGQARSNRFDVLGGGVLYAATEQETCFAEVTARLRTSPRVKLLLEDDPERGAHMEPDTISAEWRRRRALVGLNVLDEMPFVDVDHPDTIATLNDVLTREFVALGYDKNPVELADLTGPDRALTQAVALWVHGQTNEEGRHLYSGIYYKSRVMGRACWAVFDYCKWEIITQDAIDRNHPALVSAARRWDLSIHGT